MLLSRQSKRFEKTAAAVAADAEDDAAADDDPLEPLSTATVADAWDLPIHQPTPITASAVAPEASLALVLTSCSFLPLGAVPGLPVEALAVHLLGWHPAQPSVLEERLHPGGRTTRVHIGVRHPRHEVGKVLAGV